MREDDRQRATEFVKELYAAGEIDADRFGTGVAGVLAARSEAELAEVVRSLPAPVALTSQERRLAEPLEIHSGMGRLRLAGRWQVASHTHISADLGSIRLDLTEAEFADHRVDHALARRQKAPVTTCIHLPQNAWASRRKRAS